MNSGKQYIQWAQEVLRIEAEAVLEIAQSLDESFVKAVDAVLRCSGRVVVMGIGKSGHVSRKMAATLASTGTPAFFVHPAEAAHGDLGMIVSGDVVMALSNSGESDEIVAILPAIKRKNVQLICITSKPQSTMARYADIHITSSVSKEACPLGLAPTSSSTAMLALGDALAVALLQARAFTPTDFALSHPAGSLGKRLLLQVQDVMHKGHELPVVQETASLREGIIRMSETGLGMLGIVNDDKVLTGIFTDGDLRRLFQEKDDLKGMVLKEVMHGQPHTLSPTQLAVEGMKMMQSQQVNGLLVVDENRRLIGALNMHDLLKAGIV